MTGASLILRNLGRNRGRSALTVAAVALVMLVFVLLQAVVVALDRVAFETAAQLRLVVHHRTTITRLLPLHAGRRIAAHPDVQAVCGVRWFGGRIADSPVQFPSLAAETETFPVVYADFALRADELADWRRVRDAAVVGAGLARQMGWRRGDRVALRSSVPPYLTLDFTIVGITSAEAYRGVFGLRLEYLLEALRGAPGVTDDYADAVFFYWVKARPGAALDELAGDIDAMFAGSPDPTATEPEEAFVAGFARMFGDIPAMIHAVGLVAVGTTLLVVASTISISIRERAGELALLRVLGFGRTRLCGLVLGEGVALGLAGGLAGVAIALLLSGRAGHGLLLSIPYFPDLTLSPGAVGAALATGALCGGLAGIGPALGATRPPPARILRSAP